VKSRGPSFAHANQHGEKKKPLPHQLEALYGISQALATSSRTKVIQACGTGKTLVAMWAVEQHKAKTAIIFVPSLALLAQTYRAWRAENTFPGGFRHMCVCSDRSVDAGDDDVVLSDEERREFRASTDPAVVRAFLDGAPQGEAGLAAPVSVIFCTYDSAAVVGEALRGLSHVDAASSIDVAIFDEAHKTVGADDKRNAFALSDRNLPIRKRLFFTATEKLVEAAASVEDAADGRVVSMDNESLYGPTAYKLGFAEAAERGLITPFQVVASYVNDARLSMQELASPQARMIADTRALLHAMKVTGARKVITFHSRVADARAFAAEMTRIEGIPTFHVNGEMNSGERDRQLEHFGQASNGIMTNARCLTEGIDVPTVDMVAFMDPKESSTDIVQAGGRALRIAPGKSLGYMFVPLHTDLAGGETVEQAIERGDFRQVMEVLRSLTENDGVPVPWSTRLRGSLEMNNGREPLLRVIAEGIGADDDVDAQRLVAAISARILDFVRTGFDARVRELLAFKMEHGHCNVPKRHPGGLGKWAQNQRTAAKQPGYPDERRKKLDATGFEWNTLDSREDRQFRRLESFRQEHGHCRVPYDLPILGVWVQTQRQAAKRPGYPEERRVRLNAMGFVWAVADEHEEQRLEELAEFSRKHGHCNVPTRQAPLGGWVSKQRTAAKKPGYSEELRVRLDAMGFNWDIFDVIEDQRVTELAAFKREYGHCNVHAKYPGGLGGWVSNQRQAAKKQGYPEDRRARLDAMGFVWAAIDAKEEQWLKELEVFRQLNGHCNVPQSAGGLGGWVGSQRQMAKKPGYSEDRRARLDAMGFEWTRAATPSHQSLEPATALSPTIPWSSFTRVTLFPLIALREQSREEQGLAPETPRHVAALFAKEFIRIKDMEFIPFDALCEAGRAELSRLASEFAGVPVDVPAPSPASDANGVQLFDEEVEEECEVDAPRG